MDITPWTSCMNDPNVWIKNLECHPGFAAYLQVVGVIFAVLGTAAITYFSTVAVLNPGKLERKRRAKVLLYRLLPPVSEIVATCVRVRLIYDQTQKGALLADAQKIEEAIVSFRIDAIIPVDALGEMHVLEDAIAETIAQLHYYLSQYNEFIRWNVPLMPAHSEERRAKFEEHFDTLLSTVQHLAKKANGLLLKSRDS